MCAALIFALLVILVTGCSTPKEPQAFSVTLVATQGAVAIATAVPSSTPTSTLTPTLTPTLTQTPTPTKTLTPTLTLTPTITPTLAPVALLVLARPISRSGVDYVDRSYPYASTARGNWEVHHGVEFQNPRGTPVLATAPGTIYYAGDDSETLFGPYKGYYGNLVVIQHDFKSPDGMGVFTLYGHLDRVEVETGQRVATGDHVGNIGATGIAVGPHLHFEVRLDNPHDFSATRNPELWLIPYPQHGVIAGRITNKQGNLQHELALQIRRANRATVYRDVWSYVDDPLINSDNLWHENFALGDVPEGDYDVVVGDRNGRIRFKQTITVKSGDITFVDVILN